MGKAREWYELTQGFEKKRDTQGGVVKRTGAGPTHQSAYRLPADSDDLRRPPRARPVDASSDEADDDVASSLLPLAASGSSNVDDADEDSVASVA